MKESKKIVNNQKSILINNLKEIKSLKNELEICNLEKADQFKEMTIGIIEIIDTYELVIESIMERNLNADDNSNFIINRFKSVKKRLIKLLKKNGITKLEFPEGKLIIGFCKVIDTEPDSKLENDSILEVLKNGYIHGKELIREAEVIIVKN